MYYIYDGTFEGLLTIVYEKFKIINENDIIISNSESEKVLLFDKVFIDTDAEKSDRVVRTILAKGKYLLFRDIIFCFASEEKRKENIIFDYIKTVIARESNAKNYASSLEKKIDEISKRVGFEIHRLKGLVRFEMLKNGILYSKIEPDNNIVSFLVPHFEKRLANEKWIIHDLRRGTLFYHEKNMTQEFSGGSIIMDENFLESDDESCALWKKYHETIAIRERENPKLQKQFMPKRYWKYLTEKG